MADVASLKRFQTVYDENENNVMLATVSSDGVVSNSIITINQDKDKPNVFYVTTDPESRRSKDIVEHPQVGLASWYAHSNGDRFSSNNATATVTTDLKTMQEIAKPYPDMTKFNPTLEGQCVLTITLKSALIESFKGGPEVIEF